jgi:hypothetical protein
MPGQNPQTEPQLEPEREHWCRDTQQLKSLQMNLYELISKMEGRGKRVVSIKQLDRILDVYQ